MNSNIPLMQTPLVQAVRGPIMLITLGALISLDHFGSYSFSRTFPVLIIVFGVLKLLERMVVSGGAAGGQNS